MNKKAEEPEIKLPTSDGSSKKQESSRKMSISALLTTPKHLTVWIRIKCGKYPLEAMIYFVSVAKEALKERMKENDLLD